jgi:hypothetical protein
MTARHAPDGSAGRDVDQHGGGVSALAAKCQGLAVRGELDRPDPAGAGGGG